MTENIRVLIVENDSDFTYLITKTLSAQPDMEIVGRCSVREDAVIMAARLKPDIVLMDLNLSSSNMDGIDAAKDIHLSSNAKVIILTAFESPQIIIEASKKSFASGYVFKSQFEFLVETIRKASKGHTPQEQMISSLILNDLTVAEQAVLQSLFKHDYRLQSSQKTIANQKTVILKKFGLKSQKELERLISNLNDYFYFST
jgi:DNA-binding NarL/FixJ family response regulator